MLRRAACVALLVVTVAPSAGASSTTGTITSQTAWSNVAGLGSGVTVSRKQVALSGYGGNVRTLTRVAWTLGTPNLSLDATPVKVAGYSGAQHSFSEGQISVLGKSLPALAGINGDTFCGSCAGNGGDTLHGLLVHGRRIFATGFGDGFGPEVGYLPAGNMTMGAARAVPVRITLPNQTATVAAWNTFSIPGHAIAGDQVVVLARSGAKFAIPTGWTALRLAGSIAPYGAPTTVGAQFRNLLELAGPYKDSADRSAGSSTSSEWIDAYHVSQFHGTPTSALMPVSGGSLSGVTVTIPQDGVVLAAKTGTPAATGLKQAASHQTVPVTLDDVGWNTAATIMDGKFQMVKAGVAQTAYPGWSDSWPWWCQGTGRGCVRAAVAETKTQGWLVVVTGPNGSGLTMPDFARLLAQLGVTNAMAFDSNTHADFWRSGASPITSNGWEPGAPAATLLVSH